MNVVKQIAVLIVIGLVAAGGYHGWQKYGAATAAKTPDQQRGGPRVVGVVTAVAEMRQIDTIVEAVGTTRAVRSINVTPLSSGRVVEVGFASGEPVKKGAVLLRLDADVQRADLAEAEARLKEATGALKRSTILKQSRNVSEATVDGQTAAAEIAKANRDRAAKRLADRVVRAPFDGFIGFSNVEPGALVKEGEAIAVLDDRSAIDVEFSVPEALFGSLRVGDEVQARAAPFPDRVFKGNIAAIDTRIDSVSRAFKVRGLIANEDKALPAGMFVHVSIVLDGTDALAIPEEAVVVDGSRAFVFAVVAADGGNKDPGAGKKDAEHGKVEAKAGGAGPAAAKPKGPGGAGATQKVERRLVALGRRSYGYVEILNGIKQGEAVVVRGVQKVRDGALVRVNRASGRSGQNGESKPPDKPLKKPAEPPANQS